MNKIRHKKIFFTKTKKCLELGYFENKENLITPQSLLYAPYIDVKLLPFS